LLLIFYVAGVFKSYTPYLDYFLNYTYISKVLCINKNKVGSCCKGKCHLKVQLQKNAEKGKNQQETTDTFFQNLFTCDLMQAEEWCIQLFETSRGQLRQGGLILIESFSSTILGPPPKQRI